MFLKDIAFAAARRARERVRNLMGENLDIFRPTRDGFVDKLGTGQRAKDLAELPSYLAKSCDATRSRACEAQLQADTRFKGERLQKMLPPFIKWPIWKAKPRADRYTREKTPRSLKQLAAGVVLESRNVPSETYVVDTVPRLSLTATYPHGELGTLDRRHMIGLVHHAAQTTPDTDAALPYRITPPQLAEQLAMKYGDRFRERISASLWAMVGASIILRHGDPLSGSWGSRGFSVLPGVDVERHGRETHILYDLHEPAKKLINAGSLVTVDMQRLQALGSPVAETLYLLLYDLAQWYRGSTILYPIADLAFRLGYRVPRRAGRSGQYDDWSQVRSWINEICNRVGKYAGFLRDWSIEGRGAATTYGFHFANPECRLHLPKSP